jgi:hypothetical protein
MSSSPPGALAQTLPARFRIKTPQGQYLTNKLWSSISGAPTLSLDQTAPVVNFSIVASGLYSLPANYVALKDADVSASNSGHYKSSSSYVSRGTFWSSAQGGGEGWAWQFYQQSDGTFIILNNKNGVNNYFFKPSLTTDWPQVTTDLASATKFTIEDSTTPVSTPAPETPPAPAPSPASGNNNTQMIVGSLIGFLFLCICIIVAVMMSTKKTA